MDISIIIPCYNGGEKLFKCFKSLDNIQYSNKSYEVILVDDRSTDNSYEIIKDSCKERENWRCYQLEENSGSPSKPRNFGVSKSKGKYIFFLDCDDEILSDALSIQYYRAEEKKLDLLRASLIINDGINIKIANRINGFDFNDKHRDKIGKIIQQQSTTTPSFIRRDLLVDNNILWREDFHMGEDTVFLTDLMMKAENIDYIDEPVFIYNKGKESDTSSATQKYGEAELKNHLAVWEYVSKKLNKIGVNYIELRFKVALQTVLFALIRSYSHDITEDTYSRLSRLIRKNWSYIKHYDFINRFKEILDVIMESSLSEFEAIIKPRILIAGYDLKFIKNSILHFNGDYEIRLEEWTGHFEKDHDVETSIRNLDWCDIIFCEWMLGNAVWYSKYKRSYHKLIVRVHRFELTRDIGKNLVLENIDRFICVSVYYYELLNRYLGSQREKIVLLPNFLETKKYLKNDEREKVYNLGMIGINPSRKGFLRGLKLLKQLKSVNSKYSLTVLGQKPEDLEWLMKDAQEREYFDQCKKYIRRNNLTSSINYTGWVNIKESIKDIGFILSMSDDEEYPESFHLAPAEAFASGNQGLILYWRGVEYIYPGQFIFDDEKQMKNYILKNSDARIFNQNASVGIDFVEKNYSIEFFLDRLKSTITTL